MLKVIFRETRFPCSSGPKFRALQGGGMDWQVKGNKTSKRRPLIKS